MAAETVHRAATVPPGPTGPSALRLRGALFLLLAAWTLVPLGVLAVLSVGRQWFYPGLLPAEFTGEHWASLVGGGGRLARATAGSLLLGVGTGALAVLVGFPVGRAMARLRGGLRVVAAGAAFLPVAAPPLALGVGLQFSFLSAGLGGTGAGVLLAHLVPAAGYVSLLFLGTFATHDDRLEVEARSLGATPRQALLRVTLPVLRRPLVEGFILGFLVSWAQVPLTLLVGQGVVPALPVEVFAYVQSGQDALAATGAVLLVVPPLLAMAAAGVAVRRLEMALP